MTTRDLHPLLDALPDTREVVVRRIGEGDIALAVWRAAAQDVRLAYAAWSAAPGACAHAAYLAAEDQAEAAAESLAAQAEPPRLLLAA